MVDHASQNDPFLYFDHATVARLDRTPDESAALVILMGNLVKFAEWITITDDGWVDRKHVLTPPVAWLIGILQATTLYAPWEQEL
jgi:hypothetical protein